ncbi:MAG: exonuclease domain-containing protein [Dehalococcoidia bacterium]
MESLLAALQPGLSQLSPEGKRLPEPVDVAVFDGHAALIVIDLEMSGPNPQTHEVLELGGVRATLAPALPEEASWGAKVKPLHIGNAVPGALKVVGYNPKAWKQAIDLDEAMAKLVELGRGAIISGWGIGQDLTFLFETIRRTGGGDWPFAPFVLDVQPIARKLLAGTGSVDRFNLGHVADRLGIGRMGEHSALADAYATYDVLVKLVERAPAASAPG